MKISRKFHVVMAAVAALVISGAVSAKQSADQGIISDTALQDTKSRFFDEFLLADNPELSSYQKVYIEDPSVAFDKRWLRDNRTEVSKSYKTQTLERYARVFKEQLSKAFEKDGKYVIVDSKSDDALVVSANISDLDIYGPEHIQFVKHFVYRAGDATFNATLETPDGKALAKFRDHRETRDRGVFKPVRTSRVLNQRDFRFLMEKWSRQMVKHMAKY